MNKLIAILVIVSGLAFGVAHNVHATDDGWICENGSTKYDNLSGETYTVRNDSAEVWIKAGPDHYSFGAQRAGAILYVKRVTGHDTSHAHECAPKPTTTTSSTTSTTSTTSSTTTTSTPVTIATVPTTTASTTTVETSTPTTQPTTTSEISTTTHPEYPTTTVPRSLPETGGELGMVAIALAALAAGGGLTWATRRG